MTIDKQSEDYASGRDPSGDLLGVLEAAERDLAGMPDDLHVRATRDALASVRTAIGIVRSNPTHGEEWGRDLPKCNAKECDRPADWAYIGESGDLYLCSFHGGTEPVEGWVWIGE